MPLAQQLIHQGLQSSVPFVRRLSSFSFITLAVDRNHTVLQRIKPGSRTTFTGEQPDPSELLHPEDVTSWHRGAKLPRRYELLGVISLLSLAYLWSVKREPFHTELPGHYGRLFVPARLVGLAVRQAFTITLFNWFPTNLSLPLHASVTF